MLKLASLLFTLVLPLQAQAYSAAPIGTGCGGAELTACFYEQGDSMRMNVAATGLYKNALAVVAYGMQSTALQLPNSCMITTDVLFFQIVITSSIGEWLSGLDWPKTTYGQFYMQAASYRIVENALQIRTTNSLHLQHVN